MYRVLHWCLCCFGMLLLCGCWGDREEEKEQSAANLRAIYKALRTFESESHFAHPPSSLKELHAFNGYKLIPDSTTFQCPALAAPEKDKWRCDYQLHPQYESYQSPRTVIGWDKPGNFSTGGNILFADGHTQWIELDKEAYKKFTDAISARTQRSFVRAHCAECSVEGFSDAPD